MEVVVINHHPNIVLLEFYSQHRPVAWPGFAMAYELDDGDPHTFRLDCRVGEKICYGAWLKGDSSWYWGVGRDDTHGCSRCCFTCVANQTAVHEYNLMP